MLRTLELILVDYICLIMVAQNVGKVTDYRGVGLDNPSMDLEEKGFPF